MIDDSLFKNFPDDVKQCVWDGLEDGDKVHYFEPNDEQKCLFLESKTGTCYIYTVEIDGSYSSLTISANVRNKLAKDLLYE
jgi:hypothetical protein